MIKEYSLQETQKEIHEFLSSALGAAAQDAIKLQEFFTPEQAPTVLDQITIEMYRLLDLNIPGAIESASFKQSTPEELAVFKSEIQQTMLNTIMVHFAYTHEALTGGN